MLSSKNTDAPTSRLRHAVTSSGDNRHLAVFFARPFDADLDIVSESREELHQALGGKHHGWRTHLSLDKDAPVPRSVHPPTREPLVKVPHLGGLHHHDERRAA